MAYTTKDIHKMKAPYHRGAGAYTLSAILSILGVALILSDPQTIAVGKYFIISQGPGFMALLFGTIIWGIVELFTDRGKGTFSLLIRFVPSMFIGAIVGYIFGLVSGIGELLLVPVAQGNHFVAVAVFAQPPL